MKKLIRNRAWETNSSSSHSVSVAGEDKQFVLDPLYPDQNGIIYVNGGEYGWEWAKYNDAETKLSYAFQDGVDTELLKEAVMKQTGALDVRFGNRDDGYIDHDSYGTAAGVCHDVDSIINFVFNKNSWLFTGNDNDTPVPTFYHVPEFRDNKKIVPVYKFELLIEGLDKTTKFLTKPTDEELAEGITSLMGDVLMTEDGGLIAEDNIYFQISRRRDMFEKTFWVDQDYSKGYILMVREGGYVHDVEKQLQEQGKLEGLNWKQKSKKVRAAILKDENNHKKLRFTLNEIE